MYPQTTYDIIKYQISESMGALKPVAGKSVKPIEEYSLAFANYIKSINLERNSKLILKDCTPENNVSE